MINTSIFLIDAVIELSNVLISAITKISGASSVWDTLTAVVKESGGQGAAALLLMLAFLIFIVILLIYYVGRIVVLFLGAVLSPLVIVLWLLPGFRDFSVSAAKTYITTIFVLFVHVVILQLAATLFVGMSATTGNNVPNVLMSVVVGLATVFVLLKTQGMMMQFSYVSMGASNARKLGSQFMNGVSYMTGKGTAAVATVTGKGGGATGAASSAGKSSRRTNHTSTTHTKTTTTGKAMNTPANSTRNTSATPKKSNSTDKTIDAPKVTPRTEALKQPLKNTSKEKKS
jgi:type IV secretory pathway TrbL component